MKLYETITTENWGKGLFGDDKRGCIMGHIRAKNYVNRDDLYERIGSAIRVLFPERIDPSDCTVIGDFNDHPDTTVEDVIRVCKVADV